MATAADSVVTIERGGFPALGAKYGIVEATINLLTVSQELVAQGDGELATGDVIQAISLPKGTLVLAAGVELVTAIAGASALTLDVGTGDDADQWADGFDAAAASVGGLSTIPVGVTTEAKGNPKVLAAADTIDVTAAGVTGSLTAGVIRVWAAVADINDLSN